MPDRPHASYTGPKGTTWPALDKGARFGAPRTPTDWSRLPPADAVKEIVKLYKSKRRHLLSGERTPNGRLS